MLKAIKIISGLFFLISFNPVSSQFFEYGQDPGNLIWRRTDTEHFKLIYPADFSKNVNKLANTLEKNYGPNSESLNHYPSKIPVIIHNQSVISNAFVALAPRRMEFFTQPDPSYFGQDWLTELCLHEFRHVVQVDKLEQGFTRILSCLTGEQGIGITAAMLPFWFLEGDAVSAETDLSNTGRGRLPSFEMEIKAHLLNSGKPFSFSKSYLGSYKDFVPDYYRYGYQMINYAKKTYGDKYWSDAIDFTAKHPYSFFPLHHFSKRKTGKGLSSLYDNTILHLKEHWTGTLGQRKIENIPSLNIRKRQVYTSYHQPKFVNDSTILSYKTGLDIVPHFIKIDLNGNEKKVFVPGILNSGKISVSHTKLIWDEFAHDPRWTNRNFSVIKEYDLNTGIVRKLTYKTRYSAPEYSITGDTIAVIESSPQYNFYLTLISAKDGNVLERISSPDNAWLQDPSWRYDHYGIIVIAVDENGKSIISYDFRERTWSEIYDAGFFNVSELITEGKYLYFNASFDGLDNIYSFNLEDSILYKISNSKFGSFTPDILTSNLLMVFSDYSDSGYNIKCKRIDPTGFNEFVYPERITEQSFNSINTEESSSRDSTSVFDQKTYPERPYLKFTNLFKFHSWSPFYFNYTDPEIDDQHVSPGITVLSQNYLSTAISSFGYEFREKTNFIHSSFIYKGFFPVFELSVNYGGMPYVAETENEELPDLKTNLSYRLFTYIPIKLNTGKFNTGFQPTAGITYNSSYYYYSLADEYKRGFVSFEPGFYFYSYKNKSYMDLLPDLGVTLSMKNFSTPFENELFGSISALEAALYLPGLIKNHGLKLKSGWQHQYPEKYIIVRNLLTFPRGYDDMPVISFEKYTGDYQLPLLYPDLSIGPLLYLKRVRMNLFTDYLVGHNIYESSNGKIQVIKQKEYMSEGIDLYFDYHLFRFIFEFSSGIRLFYLPYEKKLNYEFLFSVNLDKF